MIKRFLLAAVVFAVLACGALALNYNVNIEPSFKSIKQNETAVYNLTITHEGKGEVDFEVYSPDVIWDIRPAIPLQVPPGAFGLTTQLFIRPLQVNPGYYGLPVSVRPARSNDITTKTVFMEVLSPFIPKSGYLPAIRGEVRVQQFLDPREKVNLELFIENLNALNIERIELKIRSSIINKDYTISLAPFEKKTIKFSIDLDTLTQPQKDILKVAAFAFALNRTFQTDLNPAEYNIISYGGISSSKDVKKEFLKTTEALTISNTGNFVNRERFDYEVSGFRKLFTTTSPPASSYAEGKFSWNLELGIGQSQTITVTTNYWPLFIIAVLAVAVIVAYYIFRSPIVLRKRAVVLSTKEGGISELKVILAVANRGSRKVRRIRIIDIVPKLADLVKHYDVGTLEPVNVMHHEQRGTIVKWHIDELDSGEEHIITYKIRSKLSILGGMRLPPAVAKFETAPDAERTTKSNSAGVNLG